MNKSGEPGFLTPLRRETWRGSVPAAGANRSEDAEQGDGAKQSQLETACSQSRPQGAEGGNSQQKRFPPSGSRRGVPAERFPPRRMRNSG